MKAFIIPQFKNYTITKNGTIVNSKTGNTLKPSVNPKGYLVAYFSIDGKNISRLLHRLIALTFIPNPENKPQVNHKNGNKLDNRICNLEWCTNDENMAHAWANGLMKKSARNGEKLTEAQVYEIRLRKTSLKDAAKKHGVSVGCITSVRYNLTWKHLLPPPQIQSM